MPTLQKFPDLNANAFQALSLPAKWPGLSNYENSPTVLVYIYICNPGLVAVLAIARCYIRFMDTFIR